MDVSYGSGVHHLGCSNLFIVYIVVYVKRVDHLIACMGAATFIMYGGIIIRVINIYRVIVNIMWAAVAIPISSMMW